MRTGKAIGARLQAGASMLEVLISVLILGIGMLGVAALQATALRNSHSSLEQSQAVIQTYAILDSLRANREAAIAGSYDMPRTCDVPPSAAGLPAAEQQRWISELKAGLGDSACGSITCINDDCEITVEWDDSRASEMDGGLLVAGASDRTTTTRTRI